jgi:TrmH family RNA methyltransferase
LQIPVRIVLVETSHPGNIGAAARAMKTMGVEDLALVAPKSFPDPEATARASGADDLLAAARVAPDLSAAIGDCSYVVGASARVRGGRWPILDARLAAGEICARLPGERCAHMRVHSAKAGCVCRGRNPLTSRRSGTVSLR